MQKVQIALNGVEVKQNVDRKQAEKAKTTIPHHHHSSSLDPRASSNKKSGHPTKVANKPKSGVDLTDLDMDQASIQSNGGSFSNIDTDFQFENKSEGGSKHSTPLKKGESLMNFG